MPYPMELLNMPPPPPKKSPKKSPKPVPKKPVAKPAQATSHQPSAQSTSQPVGTTPRDEAMPSYASPRPSFSRFLRSVGVEDFFSRFLTPRKAEPTTLTIDPRTKAPRYASPRFTSRRSQRIITEGAQKHEQPIDEPQPAEQVGYIQRARQHWADELAKHQLEEQRKQALPGFDLQQLSADDAFGVSSAPMSAEAAAERADARAKAASLSEEERARLRKIFDKFDVDGSGSVSTDELSMMLRQLGIIKSIPEVSQIVHDADPDQSGEIDFEEFLVVMSTPSVGGGGLAEVAGAAANFFGFINPFAGWGGVAGAPGADHK